MFREKWYHPTGHQVRESSWNLPGSSGTPSLLKDPVWLLFLNCGRAFAGSQSLTGWDVEGGRDQALLKGHSWLQQLLKMAGLRAGGEDACPFSPSFRPRSLKASLRWGISCQARPGLVSTLGPGISTWGGSARLGHSRGPRAEALPGLDRVLAARPTVQFSEHLPSGREGLPCLPLMGGLRAGAPGPPVGRRTCWAGGGWSARRQKREPAGPGAGPCVRPRHKAASDQEGQEPDPRRAGTLGVTHMAANRPHPAPRSGRFLRAQRGKTTYFFILKNHLEEAVTVWGRSRGPILPRAPSPSTGSLCLSLVPLLPPRSFWTPQSFVQASTPVGSRAVGDDTHLRVCLAVEAAASLGGAGPDAPLARAQPNQCADYCTHSEPPEQVV